MPKYIYKAKKGPHEVVEGEIDALSESHAMKVLDGQGLVPVQLCLRLTEDAGKSPARPARDVRRTAVKRSDIIIFTRSLAELLRGNIPLLRALTLLKSQARKPSMKKLTEDLVASVQDGFSLSQAFEQHPGVFSPLLINMVRGGETGGVLGEMMEKLALYQEKSEEIRKKIIGALVYPMFVLFVGMLTVFVLLTYFLPRLLGVYLSNQQALPWPTAMVLAISDFLSGNWYWIAGFVVLVFAFAKRMGTSPSRGRLVDELKLKIPFMNVIVVKNAVLNFSRTLGLLLQHGVPVFKGVPLAAATVGNVVIGDMLKGAEGDILTKGASLAAALRKITYFPPTALDMISVGEESGNLGKMLISLSDTCEKEIDRSLKAVTTLIEPVLILAIGGVVGFIVLAMLLPVFQMDTFVQ